MTATWVLLLATTFNLFVTATHLRRSHTRNAKLSVQVRNLMLSDLARAKWAGLPSTVATPQAGGATADPTVRLRDAMAVHAPAIPATEPSATRSPARIARDVPGHTPSAPGTAYRPAWFRAVRGSSLDILLSQSVVTVGRSPERDIVVDHPEVSRRHVTLSSHAGGWYLQDHHSPNRTFVNNAMVAPGGRVALSSGDVIGLGHDVAFLLTTVGAPAQDLALNTGAATAKGARSRNEDDHCANPKLIAVADGVGGRPAGDIAAGIAVDLVRSAPRNLRWPQLVAAIEAAIEAHVHAEPGSADMATTFEAAQLTDTDGRYRVSGVHIGDGIAILDDGAQLRELTVPHTLGAQLARSGHPRATRHPDRGRLLRAIGLDHAELDQWSEPAVAGHRYILSTDGLIKAIGTENLSDALIRLRSKNPQECADALINLGLHSPAIPEEDVDNITVVVADVVQAKDRPQLAELDPAAVRTGQRSNSSA